MISDNGAYMHVCVSILLPYYCIHLLSTAHMDNLISDNRVYIHVFVLRARVCLCMCVSVCL